MIMNFRLINYYQENLKSDILTNVFHFFSFLIFLTNEKCLLYQSDEYAAFETRLKHVPYRT